MPTKSLTKNELITINAQLSAEVATLRARLSQIESDAARTQRSNTPISERRAAMLAAKAEALRSGHAVRAF